MTTIYRLLADSQPDALERLLSLRLPHEGGREASFRPMPPLRAGAPPRLRQEGAPPDSAAGRRNRAGQRASAARRPVPKPFPDVVYAARAVTRGKRLLIVGGIPNGAVRRRIEQALACEVEWRAATSGRGLRAMKAAGRKCDLLVSLIRLSGHVHSDGMADVSRRSGIPLVRVLRGHGPAALAHDIAVQVLRTS